MATIEIAGQPSANAQSPCEKPMTYSRLMRKNVVPTLVAVLLVLVILIVVASWVSSPPSSPPSSPNTEGMRKARVILPKRSEGYMRVSDEEKPRAPKEVITEGFKAASCEECETVTRPSLEGMTVMSYDSSKLRNTMSRLGLSEGFTEQTLQNSVVGSGYTDPNSNSTMNDTDKLLRETAMYGSV